MVAPTFSIGRPTHADKAFTLPVVTVALAQAARHLVRLVHAAVLGRATIVKADSTMPAPSEGSPCQRLQGVRQGGEHRRLGEGAGDVAHSRGLVSRRPRQLKYT
jgi:hypothetical protein